MLDEFFCLNCRKYKSLLLKSLRKIGRYKKEQVCTACDERAKKRIADSKKNLEELRRIHRAKAVDNHAKKSYANERFYNYMKNSNLL